MKRTIKKVAVLGSGVMGSRIACHFAGIGVQVILLDIVPGNLPADANPAQKNKIVNDALTAAGSFHIVSISSRMSSVISIFAALP